MVYNKQSINKLISIIKDNNGIGDKTTLANIVARAFSLRLDRKVYYCQDFAIRFSKSEKKKMSNTVLSLSKLKMYDNRPFIVCIVSSTTNYIMLANTSFLIKISHSSKDLRIDNIKGSFNGSDIFDEPYGIKNEPENFEQLFGIHKNMSFEKNLARLVKSTNNITARENKAQIDDNKQEIILNSIERTMRFIDSEYYKDLYNDLQNRVEKVQKEIVLASKIDNVNIRGRIIEYLITTKDSKLKHDIINALNNNLPIPEFKTEDNLGDYSKIYPGYLIEIDIKTKVLSLKGNPKGYNVDKLLEFLSIPKSVYLVYLIGINSNCKCKTRLCSIFNKRFLDATNIIGHWAGRNSRGVAQFTGSILADILDSQDSNIINKKDAETFLKTLINN